MKILVVYRQVYKSYARNVEILALVFSQFKVTGPALKRPSICLSYVMLVMLLLRIVFGHLSVSGQFIHVYMYTEH